MAAVVDTSTTSTIDMTESTDSSKSSTDSSMSTVSVADLTSSTSTIDSLLTSDTSKSSWSTIGQSTFTNEDFTFDGNATNSTNATGTTKEPPAEVTAPVVGLFILLAVGIAVGITLVVMREIWERKHRGAAGGTKKDADIPPPILPAAEGEIGVVGVAGGEQVIGGEGAAVGGGSQILHTSQSGRGSVEAAMAASIK